MIQKRFPEDAFQSGIEELMVADLRIAHSIKAALQKLPSWPFRATLGDILAGRVVTPEMMVSALAMNAYFDHCNLWVEGAGNVSYRMNGGTIYGWQREGSWGPRGPAWKFFIVYGTAHQREAFRLHPLGWHGASEFKGLLQRHR